MDSLLLWSTEFVPKLEKQKKWSQLPHSKGKYPLLSGRRRSRHRSQIVVNDTLGDSGDSALFKYVSVLQRVAFLIPLLIIWTTSSRHFPNNKIFNWKDRTRLQTRAFLNIWQLKDQHSFISEAWTNQIFDKFFIADIVGWELEPSANMHKKLSIRYASTGQGSADIFLDLTAWFWRR